MFFPQNGACYCFGFLGLYAMGHFKLPAWFEYQPSEVQRARRPKPKQASGLRKLSSGDLRNSHFRQNAIIPPYSNDFGMRIRYILFLMVLFLAPQIVFAEDKTVSTVGSHKFSFDIDTSKYAIDTSREPIESLDGEKAFSNTVTIIRKQDNETIASISIKEYDSGPEGFTYEGAAAGAYKFLDNPMVTPRKIDGRDGMAAKDDSLIFAAYETKEKFVVAIFSALPYDDTMILLNTLHVEEV
jgi:hypothetical protein